MSKNVKGNTKHTMHWNGVTKDKKLRSGVYIYELTVGSKKLRRKLFIFFRKKPPIKKEVAKLQPHSNSTNTIIYFINNHIYEQPVRWI